MRAALFAFALIAALGSAGCGPGRLTGPEAQTTFAIIHDRSDTLGLEGMVLMLDGRRVSPAELHAVDPRTIATIEVVRAAAARSLFGADAERGAILVWLNASRR